MFSNDSFFKCSHIFFYKNSATGRCLARPYPCYSSCLQHAHFTSLVFHKKVNGLRQSIVEKKKKKAENKKKLLKLLKKKLYFTVFI